MKPPELVLHIQKFAQDHENPAMVEKYSRYFKEGYDAFGLNSEQVNLIIDEIVSMPGITQEVILETSLLLVKSPKYEMTVIAIRLLLTFKKSWTAHTFKVVERWFGLGITNWAQTDYICGELMNLFFRMKIIDMQSIGSWRTSTNKFQRRAAVVSLIKPMKLSVDFSPYFEFIAPMMHDTAREVHQGLGWFLRETWKKQPQPVEEFLLRYKDTSPRLIFQYATEKMTKEGKERFRKEKLGKS